MESSKPNNDSLYKGAENLVASQLNDHNHGNVQSQLSEQNEQNEQNDVILNSGNDYVSKSGNDKVDQSGDVPTGDVPTGDPDPLELRQLALSYDYLMYKIHDHVSGLCDATYGAVNEKQRRIQEEYFDEQLQLGAEKVRVEKMIESCKQLEMEFMKLDQLGTFVGGFLERLEALEKGFAS